MAPIITHADLVDLPDGASLPVPDGAQLTPLAEERARARGISIVRGGPRPVDLAQAVTQQVLERLGGAGGVDPEQVVREVMAALEGATPDGGKTASLDYCAAFLEQERARARRRAVITTTGKNGKGIAARMTAVIADLGGDILDISQTLVSDYFTMILIVDTASLSLPFAEFKGEIEGACQGLGIQCMVLHEDIVTSLSRV